MAIRRVEYLIQDVREETDNPNTADTKDGTIVQYFNRAQDRLMSILTLKDEQFLAKQAYIDIVSGTISYPLFADMLIKNRVISIEWSLDNSTDRNRRIYSLFRKMVPNEQSLLPGYFLQQGNIIISPVPTTNVTEGLRINYIRRPYTLDIRRGTISNIVPGVSITITGFDTTVGLPNDLLSVVNKNGTVLVENIFNDNFNTGTGVISTTSSTTGAAIGNYVLLGGSASTHCELPDLCERYLIEYAKMQVNQKDSNSDIMTQSALLERMEADIRELFSNSTLDADTIPVLSTDYLGYE